MIYYVSNQSTLFKEDPNIKLEYITVEESIKLIESFNVVQFDSETSGRDPHIADLLCVQFGNKKQDAQVIVDTSNVSG